MDLRSPENLIETATTQSRQGPADDRPPFLSSRSGDVWDTCRRIAVRIEQALRAALDKAASGAEVRISPMGLYPVTVRCDLWIPVSDTTRTRRCHAEIELAPQPHREKNLHVSGSCSRGGRTYRITTGDITRSDLPDATPFAEQLVAFFFEKTPTPPALFLRDGPWLVDFVAHLFRRNEWIGLKKANGGFQIVLYVMLAIPGINVVAAIALTLFFLIKLSTAFDRYTVVVLDAGVPPVKPRRLEFVDSCFAVLPGLAAQRGAVVAEILSGDYGADLPAPAVEQTTYLGVESNETREQIVFKLRRAEVFAQVHEYGRDLYIGWDAHLNRAYWKENTLHEGKTESDDHAILTGASVAELQFSEYDLIDVNLLGEQVHSRLRTLAARLLREHGIDQELDFDPVRRSRNELLVGGPSQPHQAPAHRIGRTA